MLREEAEEAKARRDEGKRKKRGIIIANKIWFNWNYPKIVADIDSNCPRFSPITGQLISPKFFLEIVFDLENVPQIVHRIVSNVVP